MTAALSQVFAFDGLWLLLFGVVLAGLVRGFSGFGTAMVYMPFAAQVLPPVWALITLCLIDLVGPLPAVPRALRDGHVRDVLWLAAGALVGLPAGVWLLTRLQPGVFRYSVSLLTVVLLVLLILGLRYRGQVTRALTIGIGMLCGVFGGAVGLAGPPVILLYMARPLPVAAIRASILLFLLASDAILIVVFASGGLLELKPVLLSGILTLPYFFAVWIGSLVFDPSHETVYRWVAYAIIAGSALSGLPVWD